MATSGAVTGSAALTELKKDLTQLSATLHEIFELMNMDMRDIGDAWQDGKYQEFVDGYRPQINKCEEISERYKEWCLRVLDPTIENVIAVEKTDVGGDGSGSVGGTFGGGSAAGIGGSAAMVSAASKIGSVGRLGRRAAMGSRRPTASNAQPARSASGRLTTSTGNHASGTTSARSAAKPTTSASSNAARSATKSVTSEDVSSSKGITTRFPIKGEKASAQTVQTRATTSASKPEKKQSTAQKLFAEADEICKTDNRSDKFRAKLAKSEEADFTLSSKKSEIGSSYSLGGEVSGGIKTDVKIPVINKGAEVTASIKGTGEYNSGKEASEIIGNYNFKCVEDNPDK